LRERSGGPERKKMVAAGRCHRVRDGLSGGRILLLRYDVRSFMASDGGQPGALSHLEDSLCVDDDITFAVVFGSRAANTARESSDVDIAIKFSEGLSASERFQKRCFLAGELQREDAPFIDISDIDRLPIDVANDAVNGEFLCGDEATFRTFRERVVAQFTEDREDIRRRQRDVIDRIAEDGLHG